jgi:hypothetical protein
VDQLARILSKVELAELAVSLAIPGRVPRFRGDMLRPGLLPEKEKSCGYLTGSRFVYC